MSEGLAGGQGTHALGGTSWPTAPTAHAATRKTKKTAARTFIADFFLHFLTTTCFCPLRSLFRSPLMPPRAQVLITHAAVPHRVTVPANHNTKKLLKMHKKQERTKRLDFCC
jgi:hypothetical protein